MTLTSLSFYLLVLALPMSSTTHWNRFGTR